MIQPVTTLCPTDPFDPTGRQDAVHESIRGLPAVAQLIYSGAPVPTLFDLENVARVGPDAVIYQHCGQAAYRYTDARFPEFRS